MIKTINFIAGEGECGRIDKVAVLHDVARSVFSLPSCTIIINGKESKKSAKCKAGDQCTITWEDLAFNGNIVAEDIPLDILYEDDDILVINKPSGQVVHPAPGNYTGTIVNALLYRYGDDFNTIEDDEDVVRPGIVHRLDKDTSGVMVIAKSGKVHKALASQFAEHSTCKHYIAIVKGSFVENRGKIERRIARSERDRKLFDVTDSKVKGKEALTYYTVLRNLPGYAFIKVRLETGRTHQIRVHMKSINHPIVGDVLYSRKDPNFPDAELMLHSLSLELTHPTTGERMKFVAPLPQRFATLIRSL